MKLYLDTETYSEVPIKAGVFAYAEKAEVLLAAYAIDGGPVSVLNTAPALGADANRALQTLQEIIDDADSVIMHNSLFDRTVLGAVGVVVPLQKTHDTMARAYAHGLPGSLGTLCDILGVASDKAKDKEGGKLIHLFTKPRPAKMKLRRATSSTHPEEWAAFVEYARRDVAATRELDARLPAWNASKFERKLWLLDQIINTRGAAIDLDLAKSALRAMAKAGTGISKRAGELTGGAVTALTRRDKVLQHLREEHGVTLPDLTKGTVAAALLNDITDDVRELLTLRVQAAATSPAKYTTLLQSTSSDGRLRGTLQYCGASRSGRWAGRLFQPQNLPLAKLKAAAIETGIAALKTGNEDIIYGNVVELCTSAVRGAVVASPGKKLVVADLRNIEGRVLAWLAQEEWKVKAFRDFDKGNGHDLYVLTYARSFGVTPEEVIADAKAGGSMRQLGKIQELALGYQGGVGAFGSMAKLYGIDLPEERVVEIIQAWRKAHKNTVAYWYDLEAAARSAIKKPGDVFAVRGTSFDLRDGWLRMRLPSGRYLCYANARLDDAGKIAYDGVNQYTRKWSETPTYAGKLCENLVQATARDVLAFGMLNAEAAGYEICLHVHDEIVSEAPASPSYTASKLANIMSLAPPWSLGLPLSAAGYEATRYRKE